MVTQQQALGFGERDHQRHRFDWRHPEAVFLIECLGLI
jgi:hypothetical protein